MADQKSSQKDKERKPSYFQIRENQNMKVKRAIVRCIVHDYLKEGDSILLDAGSSLYPIAEEIVKNSESNLHYTIMTHNYKAFQILVDNIPRDANLNIVLSGGRYDQDLNALFGPQTIMSYDHFFPKVVLIGISGIVADQGLFCHGNTEELNVKELIFRKSARDRIIIADYTKLGVPDAFLFGQSQYFLKGVERCILVTDAPAKDADANVISRVSKQIEQLRNTYGVQIKIVED